MKSGYVSIYQLMKYLKLHFICCFLLITSCTTNKESGNDIIVKPYPHSINIGNGMRNTSIIKLSDIADSIKYIILSKEKEVMVGSFRSIQMTEDDIYLSSEGAVMRFDKSGNYLNSIGRTGRGPEEYLPGSPYSISQNNDEVVISRGIVSDYLLFSPDGNYIGKKILPYSRNMFDFVFVSDSSMLLTYFFIGSFMKKDILLELPWITALFDLERNTLGVISNPLKEINISEIDYKKILLMNPAISYFDDRVVITPNGDTIYEANSSSIFPGYILDWGQLPHKQTQEDLFYRKIEKSTKMSITGPLLETETNAFFRIIQQSDLYIVNFSKVTGESKTMPEDPDNPGFINDLDGGANFYPYWTNRKGDVWINSDDAYSFKEKHSAGLHNRNNTPQNTYSKSLNRFLGSLKDDDNPVLTIVYLKKTEI